MKKNIKIYLIIIGLLLTVSILIGISYAYYIFAVAQNEVNVVKTDCIRVTFTDGNAININSGIPITDDEANNLIPYTFTIKNVCNHNIDYNVNIETLSNSTMDLNAIKYKIYNDSYDNKDILGNVLNNDSSIYVNNNVSSSKTIESGYLRPSAQISYNLKLWIEKNATRDQSAGKVFDSKIAITTHLRYEDIPGAILARGMVVNRRIKSLDGFFGAVQTSEGELEDSEIEYCLNSDECRYNPGIYLKNWDKMLNYNYSYETNIFNISKIMISNTRPSEDKETIVISSDDSLYEIVAWLDLSDDKELVLYIYANNQEIYLNKDSSYLFADFYYLTDFDLSNFHFDLVENTTGMFLRSNNDATINFGENIKTPRLKNMKGMFFENNANAILNFDKIDTSKVTDMSYLFSNMQFIESLNLSNLNTSNVINMEGMFTNLDNLRTIDVSNFDTTNVTNMSYMFSGMTGLTSLDVSNFDTTNVTNMSYMFRRMSGITSLNVSDFDTSKVTNMEEMFNGMSSITSLDLSNFDTSKVTDMSYMFYGMNNVTNIDVTHFNTSNVTNMLCMFRKMNSITSLDISSFDTSNVNDMRYMFADMDNITTIFVGDNRIITNSDKMFLNTKQIVGGSGTVYDETKTDSTYAIVDCGTSRPGYFTYKGSKGTNAAYCASIGY